MRPKTKGSQKKKQMYSCTFCSKEFADISSLQVHKALHTSEEVYKCELCQYTCKIKKYLARHVKKVHTKPTGNQCEVCGKCFHFECKLRDHMRVHTGEKPYKCDVCGKAFSSSYSLSGHKMIHTGEKPFQCSFCDYACRDNSTIKRHQDRHMGISKDYPCTICNKNFKKKESLQLHVDEVHFEIDTRKYPCQECDKVFKTKATRTIHVNTVHNTSNKVNCEICGAKITRNNLQAHMRRHVDVKPYKCSFIPCGRRFKDKGDLKKHTLIHYPDHQHQCDICKRRFARRSRLTAHVRVHLKNGYVQCDHCGITLSSKPYLSKHIKKAHGPNSKKYECDICGVIAYGRRRIIMHIKYGHGDEKNTECYICKRDYRKYLHLRNHYMSYHNIEYSLLPKKNEESDVIIKHEPYDVEITTDAPDFIYELNVQKQEIDMDISEEMIYKPPSPAYPIDTDTINYSKQVQSEDISRSLLERDNEPEDEFGDFFISHVMRKLEDIIEIPKHIVDEKKKEKVKQCLDKLLSEVRHQKEWIALEKLRRQYNRRIKMATQGGNKKEQTSIRYFKRPKEIINYTNIEDTSVVDKNVTENNDISDEMNDDENKNDDDDNDKDTESEEDNIKDKDYTECVSDEEVNTNGKLKFNTHQCYICFKLFKTKTDLKRHCKNHFDICNEKMLKKCPFCGYVTNLQIQKHIRLVHKIHIDIPYGRVKERDSQNGSKYVFEIDKNCELEIIPSISNLNKIASMKIDEKNRKTKSIFLGKTKLVKKGADWVVEKQALSVNNDSLLPEFSKEEYQSLKFNGEGYLERIRNLSILAKRKGVKMLYPCLGCEKLCLTMSALKLHNRKHEDNPKAFKPKVWKNKILNGKNGKIVPKKRSKVVKKVKNSSEAENLKKDSQNSTQNIDSSNTRLIDRRKLKKAVDTPKNKQADLKNRFADPNPVKNKHKCDKKLIEFYKNNIKGGDIEFWQFLKIYNKMSRENVNDFKDLENRFDFGMHINNIPDTPVLETQPQNTEPKKVKKIRNNKKKAFTRAIMISRKEYFKRNMIKNQMRRRLEEDKAN